MLEFQMSSIQSLMSVKMAAIKFLTIVAQAFVYTVSLTVYENLTLKLHGPLSL